MLYHLRPALVLFVLLSLLTGVLYPLAVTGIAQGAFPDQANGSLLRRDGVVVGSVLIGQRFDSPGYFHGRPSATRPLPYDAAASGGSNLGPTSKALLARVQADSIALGKENPLAAVPVDLVTASASGLDPDISPAAAAFELPRIAKARGMDPDTLRGLIAGATSARFIGLFGEPAVNVLKLNLALDAQAARPATTP